MVSRKNVFISFSLAQQNIRARLFHTLLSVLGIVIGVAALVAILSLIDGMEKYAQEQITNTTDLKSLIVRTEAYQQTNNVWVKKDNYAYLDYNRFKQLRASFPSPTQSSLRLSQSHLVQLTGHKQPVGARINGISSPYPTRTKIAYGRYVSEADVAAASRVAFVNQNFAKQMLGGQSPKALLGKTLTFADKTLTIVGVLESQQPDPKVAEVFMPITLFSAEEIDENPPFGLIEANEVTAVPGLKTHIEQWLKQQFKTRSTDFKVDTNELRVEQAAQGFLVFRVVMGLIVGISVLVGGIGVMNVLLISVTERTVEIGVRKAMGAKKRDILYQFLAESITVSLFGSFLGLVLGMLATLVFIPIIKAITKVPFQAAYTLNTFVIISVVAIVVGIVFGTYPALRAARLDPVEAMRRE
ncbi:Macrolide export ATP-binding/permease protein macB [Fibrisoma limi BUZ 3]|uniref:Macrolide export ATP-binding/permease protein macB n=1 Tax=Fibrisoma limi BUZ 3 TaxID=1185876 RepID=I2GJ49_9BACT|nr:ABC transporter permease [Fibrisoma limi]CCH53924.1 Macrolide export ATP-binding/permease protein macB [Fibrisoma limi BUZ 3]